MAKPLLLGECPSARGDRYWMFPLSGPPARVLCRLADIPPDPDGTPYGRWYWPLVERFDVRNLFERHQPRWDAVAAKQRADELIDRGEVRVDQTVIFLGRRVATAFGLGPEELPWYQASRGFYALPHPSGLNRLYNDPEVREIAGAVLRGALMAGVTGDGGG